MTEELSKKAEKEIYKNLLNESENNELIYHTQCLCELSELVWERDNKYKPIKIDLKREIDDDGFTIMITKKKR